MIPHARIRHRLGSFVIALLCHRDGGSVNGYLPHSELQYIEWRMLSLISDPSYTPVVEISVLDFQGIKDRRLTLGLQLKWVSKNLQLSRVGMARRAEKGGRTIVFRGFCELPVLG